MTYMCTVGHKNVLFVALTLSIVNTSLKMFSVPNSEFSGMLSLYSHFFRVAVYRPIHVRTKTSRHLATSETWINEPRTVATLVVTRNRFKLFVLC